MSAYEEVRQRHVERLLGLLPEHLDRLAWSRETERLDAWRTARLRAMVTFAREHSRWHRDRLAKVDVGALDAGRMPGLLVMTKHDLMSAFDDIVTDDRVTLAVASAHLSSLAGDAYLFDEYHAVASGGSSGVRGVFVRRAQPFPRPARRTPGHSGRSRTSGTHIRHGSGAAGTAVFLGD